MGKLAARIPGHPVATERCAPSVPCPSGRVIVTDQDAALAAAVVHQTPSAEAIAEYSDGSRLDNGDCGYAAVTQIDPQQNSWKRTSAYIGDNKETYRTELFGIAAGLEMALTHTLVRSNSTGRVRLCTYARNAYSTTHPDSDNDCYPALHARKLP
ncbi:hypothetical protein FN846DRAFT_914221 [Sphaerosporella brunnea]|uniref:RNase H type-1 domain-containing protein n=1 Tax=Sphaerosporella brunnea TaxID=1250544 RepID=A0A5J5EE05_9PEZI|nr:hypothetical protein FN846DRAFT_914221 [Sphaerosporella brunnea]